MRLLIETAPQGHSPFRHDFLVWEHNGLKVRDISRHTQPGHTPDAKRLAPFER
jgi:hypothetical protein